MRNVIQIRARESGIVSRFGWHTFRHTYSTLLRANHTDVKVMQELLRNASSRGTLETYTQAITAQKREARIGRYTNFQRSAKSTHCLTPQSLKSVIGR